MKPLKTLGPKPIISSKQKTYRIVTIFLIAHTAAYSLTKILDYLVSILPLGSLSNICLKVILLRIDMPLLSILATLVFLLYLIKEINQPIKLTKEEIQYIFDTYDLYVNGTVEEKISK